MAFIKSSKNRYLTDIFKISSDFSESQIVKLL